MTTERNARSEYQPRGGTELLYENYVRFVGHDVQARIALSVSELNTQLPTDRPRVLWQHQSYDQPCVQDLRYFYVQNAFDHFVFVSQWQRMKFIQHFGIPSHKTTVIKNAIRPFTRIEKPSGPIRLIYTSTPFRGLDVLLDSFSKLNRTDVELHIYSGMALYGRPEEDRRFIELYEKARQLEHVHYHGVQPNEVVREALSKAHIFAYPSTWEETSCLSLIEALAAGCLAVVPKLGALSETSEGYALEYQYQADKQTHATAFVKELNRAIDSLRDKRTEERFLEQMEFFNHEYSWTKRAADWQHFIEKITDKQYERV